MKRKILFFSILTVLVAALVVVGCKKNPTPITLGTLMIGNIDLNGAVAPSNVPVKPTIAATFNIDVDAATATAANITLTEDYDTVDITLDIQVSGKTVSITPTSNLANGALYKLAVKAGLKASNGEMLNAFNRSFTTLGSFLPSGPVAYWRFEGNADDQTGNYNALAGGITDITYVTGRNANAGQSAQFNGTTSLIEIPNGDVLENTTDFSISFWMKADTNGNRDLFVLGLSAWYGFQFEYNSNVYAGTPPQIGQCKLAAQYQLASGSASEDLWFDGTGNLGWQGWTFCKDLVSGGGTGVNGLLAQKWAHIVCTYNSTTKVGTMYINGQKMKSQDFNNWPVGDPKLGVTGLKWAGTAGNNMLAFGFIQDKTNPTVTDSWADYNVTTNNHYKGQLDDIAIYHKVLSPTLITLMYNSGK